MVLAFVRELMRYASILIDEYEVRLGEDIHPAPSGGVDRTAGLPRLPCKYRPHAEEVSITAPCAALAPVLPASNDSPAIIEVSRHGFSAPTQAATCRMRAVHSGQAGAAPELVLDRLDARRRLERSAGGASYLVSGHAVLVLIRTG